MLSDEFFVMRNGKKTDAELHELILAEGNEAQAVKPVRQWLRQQGWTTEQINDFLGVRL